MRKCLLVFGLLLAFAATALIAKADGEAGSGNNQESMIYEYSNKVLEVPNSYEQETRSGFQIYNGLGCNGPDCFAIISQNDILIMQSSKQVMKRYINGQHVSTFNFEEDDYCFLETDGQYAYAVGRKNLLRIDLSNSNQEYFPYPSEEVGDYVYAAFLINNTLVLQTEPLGNYYFDSERERIGTTSQGFRREIIEDDGVLTQLYYGDHKWVLDSNDIINQEVGIDEDGNLILYSVDFGLETSDPAYSTVKKINRQGEILASTEIDCSNWLYSAELPVRIGNDGNLYVMAVYEPYTAIYTMEWSFNTIVAEPSIPAPANPVFPREGDEIQLSYEFQAMPASRTRDQVLDSAKNMMNTQWTLNSWNCNWTVEYDSGLGKSILNRPAYLKGKKAGDTIVGIPYAWNKMNGLRGECEYPFLDCVNQTCNVTGNITDTYIYSYPTIGIDCSAFVSAAYGLTNKVSTALFFSGTNADIYYPKIEWNDLKSMDMVVKDGHVLLFWRWKEKGKSFYTIESAAFNDGRKEDGKVLSRVFIIKEHLDYKCRRPINWGSSSCQHSNTFMVGKSSRLHSIICRNCGKEVRTGVHKFQTTATSTHHIKYCSLCDYTLYETHRFSYSNITKAYHTKTCTVCQKKIRERHSFSYAAGYGVCTQCGYRLPYTPDSIPEEGE